VPASVAELLASFFAGVTSFPGSLVGLAGRAWIFVWFGGVGAVPGDRAGRWFHGPEWAAPFWGRWDGGGVQ